MCRSGTQVELPRRLAMSQVGLVDDHTLHQPCVQSLSFKSTLALWMPAHWTPSLWPTVAIPQRKKWHLPGGRITSGDLPLRTHTHTHTRTHTHTCLLYDKEWGSLRSPTPCVCMHFICVSTAWKGIAGPTL